MIEIVVLGSLMAVAFNSDRVMRFFENHMDILGKGVENE